MKRKITNKQIFGFSKFLRKIELRKISCMSFVLKNHTSSPLNRHHLIFFKNLKTGDPGVCLKHYFNPSYLLVYA